jgi:4-amino-4-deoxy-L-arabinose transferase-like glycosyltransferase
MSRGQSLAVALLVWAAIYLPALGSLPIKGEEGRRILPAISMIETGNYIVPQVAGEAYFRKPPLINWLVAASFKVFGQRNEWTARLPSALCVLGVAVAFVTLARTSLGATASTTAAIIWLTNAGMIEKGRLVEIEALYVSLSALAMICWLTAWERQASPWVLWIPASIVLGLGWLAKGPVHLTFFYAVVAAVLWQHKIWRPLVHPAHFIGILIMLAIFAAWAIPFAHVAGSTITAAKWADQFTGRIRGSDFRFATWIWNVPRGLVYFLPWTLLLPLARPCAFLTEKDRRLARAVVWGAAVPFVFINLIPGSLPRYAMPAIGPACWLLGATLSAENVRWPQSFGGAAVSAKARRRTVAAIALAMSAAVAVYAIGIVPRLRARQNVKQLAAQIDGAVPSSQLLYAFNSNYQPVFFYIRSKLVYVNELNDLPVSAVYVLVRPKNERAILENGRWAPRHVQVLFRLKDYRGESISLFKID